MRHGLGRGRAVLLSRRREGVYLDLSFFRELSERFGAPGDFARAYVIAHEIGHHVQNQLRSHAGKQGTQRVDRRRAQADCFAGVWGNRGAAAACSSRATRRAGLRAAAAIGDDRLQKMSTGHVQPESWTHGSSAQRTRHCAGARVGDPEACRMTGMPVSESVRKTRVPSRRTSVGCARLRSIPQIQRLSGAARSSRIDSRLEPGGKRRRCRGSAPMPFPECAPDMDRIRAVPVGIGLDELSAGG